MCHAQIALSPQNHDHTLKKTFFTHDFDILRFSAQAPSAVGAKKTGISMYLLTSELQGVEDVPGMSSIFRISRLGTSDLKKDGVVLRSCKDDPKTGPPKICVAYISLFILSI